MNSIKILILSHLLLVVYNQYTAQYINETEWEEISKNLVIADTRYSNKYCYYLNLFC